MEKDKNTISYHHINNIKFGYTLIINNVKIIPVKHLTMLNMYIQNNLVTHNPFEGKVYVTEKTIEKYNIDINKTYVGAFNKYSDKIYLPTIVNLKYDNGIPPDTGDIFLEEQQRQINKIRDMFVEQYGPNFMDNFAYKLNFIHLTKNIKPYINNDFNMWAKFAGDMKPMYMKGVILHKDVQYEDLFSKLDTLNEGMFRPREKRPINGKEMDTLYVESYNGIADLYDYGLDHIRYTDYELDEKPHYPYMEGIDFINFKQV